jgi:phosphoribosylamine--glycine ligase
MPMKVLVIGNGGREHALVWKIAQSNKVNTIYCAPGNAGTAELAENVAIKVDDINGLLNFALSNKIDMTVVGPELPLTLGIADAFMAKGLTVFGPDKKSATLEGSKIYAKEFMAKHHIPTADFKAFYNRHKAREFVAMRDTFPVVVKADGLAAGKGVIICQNRAEANAAVDIMMMDKSFGEAGSKIIIEDFLEGVEMSVLAFTDGQTMLPMASAKDYKKVGEGDTGKNTGGMGAISPNPEFGAAVEEECRLNIFEPTLKALQSEGMHYRGVLYFGLIITDEKIRVLEFNARFGDPETQVVLPRMKNDIMDVFLAVINDNLAAVNLEWHPESAATVVMASGGYPDAYAKGKVISGLTAATEGIVFHAGTGIADANVVTNGGRVLAVTAMARDTKSALQKAYEALSHITFEGAFFRSDIGR